MGTQVVERGSNHLANRFGIISGINPDAERYYDECIQKIAGLEHMNNVVKRPIDALEHFWKPYCNGSAIIGVQEVLLNVARELEEKDDCRYIAAATGAADFVAVMDYVSVQNYQTRGRLLPIIRLGDVLLDELSKISREFCSQYKHWPKVYLAGTQCLTSPYIPTELLQFPPEKADNGRRLVDCYWRTTAEMLQSTGIELMSFTDSRPRQHIDEMTLNCGRERRGPNYDEKMRTRSILLSASMQCDYIVLPSFELVACLDLETIYSIHENNCTLINGAELHAKKIAKLVKQMPQKPC